MNEQMVAAGTTRATTARRQALLALGGAGLAALLRPGVTSAAKSANNAKKRCDKEKQQCRQAVQQRCAGNQACLDSFLQCCDTCKVGAGVICVLSQP